MKLRRLLLYALIATATVLAGCEEKEPDEPTKPADIKLSQTEINAPIKASTATITLISNRDWSLRVSSDDPTEDWVNWLKISPVSGTASESVQTVTFTFSSNENGGIKRGVTITFTAETATATLTINQDGGTPQVSYDAIKISDLRALAPADKESDEKITIDDQVKITGVVVSSASPQTSSSRNIFIQDGTDPHCGILIYSNTATIWSECKLGDKVEVILTGGKLYYFYKLMEFTPENDANISVVGHVDEIEYAEISGQELMSGDYESQFVKLYAQVIGDDLEKTMGESPKVETKDGSSFIMYTRNTVDACPEWSTQKVPQGAGNLIGVCGSYSGVYQIVPQTQKGWDDMTHDRF